MPPAVAPAIRSSSPARAFGRFALLRLIGKSEATMTWLAVDGANQAETMLTMPRVPPVGLAGLGNWLLTARRAARLDHPNLAAVVECGVHEHWPFIAVERQGRLTLDEWLAEHPRPGIDDCVVWIAGILRGLAFAHDAGVAHLDLQGHNILIGERGQASVMALAAATQRGTDIGAATAGRAAEIRAQANDGSAPKLQRAAAERDILACGIVLHRLLAGAAALDSSDVAQAIERIAPHGRELVRLPWKTPLPIPEALRAIVDRSTSGQVRLRYHNARTFLGALEGWHDGVGAEGERGPVALLLDRLSTVGDLPALPGLAQRVQRVTAPEGQRTEEIAEHLLADPALSFTLLKSLSSARVQGTQIAGAGPVLTLSRVVSLIGVNGVREAANALRPWPGPLDPVGADALMAAIDRARLAGHLAQALRPAGYDGEAVYLVAVLQNLGRLLVRYHFADEAAQIHQLTQPAVPARSEGPGAGEPGLGEEAAAYAVLGVGIEAFGSAAARQWGLGEGMLHMIHRVAADAPVRVADTDGDVLRTVASAANETIDALALAPAATNAALGSVVARYARSLQLTAPMLQEALQDAKAALRRSSPASAAGSPAPAGATVAQRG